MHQTGCVSSGRSPSACWHADDQRDFRPAEHHGDHGSAVQLCDLLCDGRAVQIAQGGRLPSRQRQPRYRAAPAGCPDRLSWKKRLAPDELPGHALHQPDDGDGLLPGNGRGGAGVAITQCLRGAENLPPEEGETLGHPDLLVHMGDEQNFVYQIWPQQYSVPGFTYRARSGKSTYYRLETFLLEGSRE